MGKCHVQWQLRTSWRCISAVTGATQQSTQPQHSRCHVITASNLHLNGLQALSSLFTGSMCGTRDTFGQLGSTRGCECALGRILCRYQRLPNAWRANLLCVNPNPPKLTCLAKHTSSPRIMQVPVLFTGSMRDNMDPFGQHSDAEVWAALRRAHLAPIVENSPQVLCWFPPLEGDF